MKTEIILPKMGLTMEEAVIVAWEKQIGGEVKINDVLVLIETDKATLEIEASAQGYLVEQLVQAGERVAVGSILGYISSELLVGSGSKDTVGGTLGNTSEHTVSERMRISPAARKLARQRGANLSVIAGTGPQGRILLKDIEHAAESCPVVKFARNLPEPEQSEKPATRKPLSSMRKTIAEKLTYSCREIPQFQIKRSANLTNVLNLRATLVNSFEQTTGVRLSVLDFVIQATAQTLKRIPKVNCSFRNDDDDEPYIIEYADVHIGIAVTVEGGLMVPVIRNADQLSLLEIATQRNDLVERAKAGKLMPEEYSGATFTISNLAAYDVDEFVALIHPPEAGILAIGKAKKMPVVVDDCLQIASLINMNGSFDHRPLDGSDGAEFMQFLVSQLESDRWVIV